MVGLTAGAERNESMLAILVGLIGGTLSGLTGLGGWTAQLIPGPLLRKGFAVVMAMIAVDMFFRK